MMLKVLASSLIMLTFSEVQAVQAPDDAQSDLTVLQTNGIHLSTNSSFQVKELTGTGFAWQY